MARNLDPCRIMASGLALAGLITMMVAPSPSWEGIATGVVCLFLFCVLWLVPRSKPRARRGRKIQYVILDAPIQRDQPRKVGAFLPSQGPEFPSVRARLQPWRTGRPPALAPPLRITAARSN